MMKIILLIVCSSVLLNIISHRAIGQTLSITGITSINSGNIGYIQKDDKTAAYYFLSLASSDESNDDQLINHLLTIVDINLLPLLTYNVRLSEESFIKGIAEQEGHFGIIFANDQEQREWLEVIDKAGNSLRTVELVFPIYHEGKIPVEHHLTQRPPITGVSGGFIVQQHTAPHRRAKGWREHQVFFYSIESTDQDWKSEKTQLEDRDYFGAYLWSNDTLVLSNQIAQGFNMMGNYTVLESQILAHDLRNGELLFTYSVKGARESPRLAWITDDGFAAVGLVYGGESKAQLTSNSYSVYEVRFNSKGRHLKTYYMDYYKDIPALIGEGIQEEREGIKDIGYLYFHRIDRLPDGQLVLNLESFDLEKRGHINDGFICIMDSQLTLKSIKRISKKQHGASYNIHAQKIEYRMTTHPTSWERTTAIDQGHGNYLVPRKNTNTSPFEPVSQLSNDYFDFIFQSVNTDGTVTFSYYDQEKTDDSKTNIQLVTLEEGIYSNKEIGLPNGVKKYFIWPNSNGKITLITHNKKDETLELVIQ